MMVVVVVHVTVVWLSLVSASSLVPTTIVIAPLVAITHVSGIVLAICVVFIVVVEIIVSFVKPPFSEITITAIASTTTSPVIVVVIVTWLVVIVALRSIVVTAIVVVVLRGELHRLHRAVTVSVLTAIFLVHAAVIADLGTILTTAKLTLRREAVIPVNSDLLIVD